MRTATFLLAALLATCSPPNEKPVSSPVFVGGPDALEGEYQIGDGTWTIVPVKMAFEMRNAPDAEPVVLFFQSMEADTLSVYANEGGSVTLKMNPGHTRGMYYEPDEQWEVLRVGLLTPPDEMTEAQETEHLRQQQVTDAATAEETWPLYSGEYQLYTESEGARGLLKLRYLNNKKFAFEIKLDVAEVCQATVQGEFAMGQPDSGTYTGTDCPLTITLKGSWNYGMTVQIEQPGRCTPLGDACIFSGTYVTSLQ